MCSRKSTLRQLSGPSQSARPTVVLLDWSRLTCRLLWLNIPGHLIIKTSNARRKPLAAVWCYIKGQIKARTFIKGYKQLGPLERINKPRSTKSKPTWKPFRDPVIGSRIYDVIALSSTPSPSIPWSPRHVFCI